MILRINHPQNPSGAVLAATPSACPRCRPVTFKQLPSKLTTAAIGRSLQVRFVPASSGRRAADNRLKNAKIPTAGRRIRLEFTEFSAVDRVPDREPETLEVIGIRRGVASNLDPTRASEDHGPSRAHGDIRTGARFSTGRGIRCKPSDDRSQSPLEVGDGPTRERD